MSENQRSPLRVDSRPALKISKSERTRVAILNAALDVVWTRPFRDMSVSSAMATTDVSRSTFYQYFEDLHEVMATLLDMLQGEILEVADPWLAGLGDPVGLLRETLQGLVSVCYERGPFLRAVTDAAAMDKRFEKSWRLFLKAFDDAANARIEADQRQGLIPAFDARPIAIALNRLDAPALLDAFGQHPRSKPEPVRKALTRVWVSSLYGCRWLETGTSDLVRACEEMS